MASQQPSPDSLNPLVHQAPSALSPNSPMAKLSVPQAPTVSDLGHGHPQQLRMGKHFRHLGSILRGRKRRRLVFVMLMVRRRVAMCLVRRRWVARQGGMETRSVRRVRGRLCRLLMRRLRMLRVLVLELLLLLWDLLMRLHRCKGWEEFVRRDLVVFIRWMTLGRRTWCLMGFSAKRNWHCVKGYEIVVLRGIRMDMVCLFMFLV
jgi:hypothetical protein